MPIHMGIMCERCRKVFFIATSPNIRPSPVTQGMYRLICKQCPEAREFRKEAMLLYRVSDDVYNRGYAHEPEYQLIEAKLPRGELPKGRRES
jgi:hypothetical protein